MKNPAIRLFRWSTVSLALALATLGVQANTAVEPAPRMTAGATPTTDQNWIKRHESFLEIAKQGGVDVLFLGDSITDFWQRDNPNQGGKPVWEENFAPLHAANFGISADRTQHVLWRLGHGEVDGIKPKVVVLMIGTNNTGFERGGTTLRNTPAEAAAGVTAVVKTLRAKLPATKVLLLAVFPRAEKADDPARMQVAEVNRIIAGLDDGKYVRYLDIGPKFLAEDGTLTKEIMPDSLHPSLKGYEIWAAAIKAPLAEMMK